MNGPSLTSQVLMAEIGIHRRLLGSSLRYNVIPSMAFAGAATEVVDVVGGLILLPFV